MTTLKEKIEVMSHFENGGEILYKGTAEPDLAYKRASTPIWNWSNYVYKIALPLTREEITAKWVKDNDLKQGDYVKVSPDFNEGKFIVHNHMANYKWVVCGTSNTYIIIKFDEFTYHVPVEYLKKIKIDIVPFTFEDREMFRGKWVKNKVCNKKEWQITSITIEKIMVGDDWLTYEEAFEQLEFIDGTPFGKEIWE